MKQQRVQGYLKWLLCVLLVMTGTVAAAANPTLSAPEKMLKGMTDQLLTELKAKRQQIKSNPKMVYALVDRILVPHIDFTKMSKSVLAHHWRKASKAQRQRFEQVFSKLVIRSYSAILNGYTNESVRFIPLRGGVKKRRVIEVRSKVIQNNGQNIPVYYRLVLKNKADDWKVFDLTINGISLVNSFRTQFGPAVAEKGLDGVIKDIEKLNNKDKA